MFLLSVPASATEFEPFATHDQNPLVQIYGLPTLGAARVLKPGRSQISLNVDAANHFYNGSYNDSEFLTLDGETHRAAIIVRRGEARFEWGLEIPFLSHSGGFMDSFIESWHDTFNMPNGSRELVPRDRLRYSYRRDGVDRVHFTEANRGIGDVRVYGGVPLDTEGTIDLTLRAGLKLPTGNANALRGSGATDFAVWLVAGCEVSGCPANLYWTFAGGILAVGRGDVMPDLQKRLVTFGGVTLGYPLLESFVVKAELLAHPPLYKGGHLAPLSDNAIQLIVGGSWRITSGTTLEIGVAEDINVDSAPDVGFVISLRTHFPN